MELSDPIQSLESPPLALYVHLPWCVRKCPYCDFNSHKAPDRIPAEEYVTALLTDLEQALPETGERTLISIFIGGGTPSLFPPAAIARLLAGIRARCTVPDDTEVTLEANPGTLEAGRFAGFRAAGVNRLSLGIQSFADRKLAALGRIHDGSAAQRAAEEALTAGFNSINLDLMYGLPGQSVDEALVDLAHAIELRPDHLSWYELTLEPNTLFWSRPPELPDADTQADIEAAGSERLRAAGYARYEVSAWAASPPARCRHNWNYWRFGDYLGIGAGAHSKITDTTTGKIERLARVRAPARYMERAASAAAIAHRRELTAADAALEFLLNALRLPEGFPSRLFTARTGVPLAWLEPPLASAQADGLLECSEGVIRPSAQGLCLLNGLLARFDEAIADWRAPHERLTTIPVAVA